MVPLILQVAGAALVSIGAAMLLPAAGFIVAGAFLLLFGVASVRGE